MVFVDLLNQAEKPKAVFLFFKQPACRENVQAYLQSSRSQRSANFFSKGPDSKYFVDHLWFVLQLLNSANVAQNQPQTAGRKWVRLCQ